MSKEQTESSASIKVEDKRFWQQSEEQNAQADQARASAVEAEAEVLPFQAETARLLDLFIHSVYSNKEIFLRELISNASDALDRLRFEALTRPELQESQEPEIRLEPDAERRTLTIHDDGIGMSREELVDNIGTIARSGTRELLDKLAKRPSSEEALSLIGQFGVGFYSSFMVADRVELVTRRAGEAGATRWESAGDGTFTVASASRPGHGTSITLHLKPVDADDGLDDFTDRWVLERIIKKYSDFVRYPIRMRVQRQEPELDEEGKPKPDGESRTVEEDSTLNSMKAIWSRRPGEVEQAEYDEFYKHITHDWEAPLKTITLSAEGRLEYKALLFVPTRAPFDLYRMDGVTGLQLYAQSVLIVEHCEELLPPYLRFVRGVVDSADISLNVSRELLQQDRQIAQIRAGITKKVLDTLAQMQKEDEEAYGKLWAQFGPVLKEGVTTDVKNRERVLPLLRFASSADEEQLTTLDGYLERMQDGQDAICYLTGESRAVVESSPHLESFRAKGVEVLLLTDTVDELLVEQVTEYQGKKLVSAGKGTVELGTEEERAQAEKERKEQEGELKGLLELLRTKLQQQVKEVRLSGRLTESPACLVGEAGDMSPRLERLLRRGQLGGGPQKRILELNPNHAIVGAMRQRYEANADDPLLPDFGELLLGQALLAEGSELPDPAHFGRLMSQVMLQAAAVPPNAASPEASGA